MSHSDRAIEAEQRRVAGAHPQRGERDDEGQGDRDEHVEPARRLAQRQAAQDGRDRVGLHLGARHQLVVGDGDGVEVLQRRRGRADDDDAAAQLLLRHAAVEEVLEAVGGDRARGPVVVDQRGVERLDLAPGRRLHRGDGEGLEPVDRRGGRAARPRRCPPACSCSPRGRPPRASTSSPPSTFVRPFGSTSVVERTVPGARATASKSARSERGAGARLGELDVVGDRPDAARAQDVDRLRVVPAVDRPLPEGGDRLGVDVDDGDVGRRLGAADLEARVLRLALEAVEQAGGRGREGDERGDEPRGHDAEAPAHGRLLPRAEVRARLDEQRRELRVQVRAGEASRSPRARPRPARPPCTGGRRPGRRRRRRRRPCGPRAGSPRRAGPRGSRCRPTSRGGCGR